jgi:transposase
MVVVEGSGLPIGLHVDSAQPHELRLAEATLRTIAVPCRRGRPKTRPKELVADKAYDSADFRRKLRRRMASSLRFRPLNGANARNRSGVVRSVLTQAYRQRWKVERCFGWMDNCRRLVVRYERHLAYLPCVLSRRHRSSVH